MSTRSTTTARRSFLTSLVTGAAGLLAFPFRRLANAAGQARPHTGKAPAVRPHPDAVPRTSRGDSAHG